jgi:hypothetical protein
MNRPVDCQGSVCISAASSPCSWAGDEEAEDDAEAYGAGDDGGPRKVAGEDCADEGGENGDVSAHHFVQMFVYPGFLEPAQRQDVAEQVVGAYQDEAAEDGPSEGRSPWLVKVTHGENERPWRCGGDDAEDGVEGGGAAAAKLDGAVSGVDVVDAEDRDDEEEGAELEDEDADDRGDDDDGVGVHEEAAGAAMQAKTFRAENGDQTEAKRQGSAEDVQKDVRYVCRRVMEHAWSMRCSGFATK